MLRSTSTEHKLGNMGDPLPNSNNSTSNLQDQEGPMSSSSPAQGGGGGSFFMYFLLGRWFYMFAAILIMAAAGATYLFGVYSKEIKKVLGYNQTTLNLLGFFKDLGANVGILSGLLDEISPIWFVLLVGAAMNFTGYFMIYLAVAEKIPRPQVWHMCLYICMGANSQNFANTGALAASVRNFPESRGIMIGLLKGFTGLSGAILTQVYLAVYGNDSKSLILLIAWLPAALSVIFVYTIRDMKVVKQDKHELKVFYQFMYISIALALFLLAMNILENVYNFTKLQYSISAAIAVAMLFLPLLVSLSEEILVWKKTNGMCYGAPIKESVVKKDDKPGTKWNKDIFNVPPRGDDYTILQALLSADMLILFVATCCGLGSSLTSVDNLGQIGESLGYPQKTIKTFVSLLSIWNFFGRIFSGFVSEALLVKYKFPRPLFMTLVLLLASVGNILVAFPFSGSVYVASIIIGFSFGAQLPLLFAIISELFGLKHYSTLFNCGQIASPLGSYIMNVKLTGPLYDIEAMKNPANAGIHATSPKELICIGAKCYRMAFIVLTCVTTFGALSSLVLVYRTKEFYKSDIYKKFRDEADEPIPVSPNAKKH